MGSYEDKIRMAVTFIEKNLSKDLSWTVISRECGISEFHFHRIFSAVMKETPRNFIIRKRLEAAMARLAYGSKETPLIDIALESGYSSQSNFSKAFKAYFGITPKQAQEKRHPENSKIGKIKSIYGKDFAVENLYPKGKVNEGLNKSEVQVKVEIKNFPTRKIAYATSKEGYKRESVFQVWNDMMTSLTAQGIDVEAITKFGIGHDNPQVTPQEKCRYDACVLAEDLPKTPNNLKSMDLPQGKYACFHYKGKGSELLDFYLDIYSNWFTDNGYEPGDFPLVERYIVTNVEDPDGEIELETQFLLK